MGRRAQARATSGGSTTSEEDRETAEEVLRGGKKAGEKLLGIDDESLRKVQADRRTAAEKARGGLARRMQTFWGFWWLWASVAEADAEDHAHDDAELSWKRHWIRFVLSVMVGVILGSAAVARVCLFSDVAMFANVAT